MTCDNVVTLPKTMPGEDAIGHLDSEERAALDQALRCALDIP
jgi:mRNA-degrading endonuclease toxin of MazEF toxin-antitoxin module